MMPIDVINDCNYISFICYILFIYIFSKIFSRIITPLLHRNPIFNFFIFCFIISGFTMNPCKTKITVPISLSTTVTFVIFYIRFGLYNLCRIIVSERPSSALSVKRFRCVWATSMLDNPIPRIFMVCALAVPHSRLLFPTPL